MKDRGMKSSGKSGKNSRDPGNHSQVRWILMLVFSTVILSGLLSLASVTLLSGAGLLAALGILLMIVAIGVVFDVIGVAVTAADERPFHAMAAHKVPGAKEALSMLRRADRVSSFCNDVIGDVCGIVSGTASAAIAALALAGRTDGPAAVEILLAALVSGLTVGGKACGKRVALMKSTEIVHLSARIIYYLKMIPNAISGLFRRSGSSGKR